MKKTLMHIKINYPVQRKIKFNWMKPFFKLFLLLLFLSILSNIAFAQQKKEIAGYVFSASEKNPLSGIKVSTKFRKVKSVTTDNSGFFNIKITDSTSNNSFMLVFSYPGYNVKEQYGVQDDTMMVYLSKTGEYRMDNLIYTPYGDKKYTSLASAVENVDFRYNSQVMSGTFEQLLESSTVNVTSVSGAPGEGRVLNIRGYSTIFADEKPLVVVDGQIIGNFRFNETTIDGFYQDPLVNIDPRNIESITILKDAVSTAIYGGKASNGVILIKTKAAKVGKTEFDITGHYGTNFMNNRLPVIQNSDYFKPYLLEQMYGSDYLYSGYFIEDDSYVYYNRYNNNTNWQDYIFKPGKTAGANINVRGGDAIAKYFFAGGYLHDEGSVDNTEYNRFNARFNADMDMTDWLTAQANLGVTYSNAQLRQQGVSYANPMLNSLVKAPFLYPYLIDTNNVALPLTEDADLLGFSNPYEVINNSDISFSSYNFLGTVNFNIHLSKTLESNVRVGSELNKLNEFVFIPNHGFFNNEYPEYNQVKKGISNFGRRTIEVNLKYNKTLNEVHNWDGIIGFRKFSDEIIQDIGTGVGTPNDEFKDLGATREEGRTKSGFQYYRKDVSNFLSVAYNYKDEYFVNFTVAADASSNVGNDAKPQLFGVPVAFSPALGFGWNLTDRKGLNYETTVNYLKLRISVGQNVNTVFDPYISRNFYYPMQYTTATGYVKTIFENEELKWEKTLKVDIGADLVMLNQKFIFTGDIYFNNTRGLLNNSYTQIALGNEYWKNSGNLNTIGSEITGKYKVIDNSIIKWRTELSLAQYITTASGLENDLIYNIAEGQKIFRNNKRAGAFYGYEVVGVIASDDEAKQLNLSHSNGTKFKAGDIQFKDQDNNTIIDDRDKVIIGNATPDFYGSWVNEISYKQFSLLADISFVVGNDVYNYTRREIESMDGYENQSIATLRRWQVNNDETDMPASAWGDPVGNSRFSTRWIENGSFARLKRLTLSVNLNKWLKSANRSEFYISAINLITFDKYLGYDPEFAFGSSILWEGIDYCKFPQNKSIMLGVKFGL